MSDRIEEIKEVHPWTEWKLSEEKYVRAIEAQEEIERLKEALREIMLLCHPLTDPHRIAKKACEQP
jgi:hypothetical protein